MTERIFKESHRERTIKYFMTTDHHLKSFLWFHMNHQNIPGILYQCTQTPSLSFPCTVHWKCHYKIHDPAWDSVNGVTALSCTLKSEVVLSFSRGFLGNPGGVSEPLLCFGPKKITTGTGSLPWITSVCIFMAAPISPIVISTNEGVSLCYSQQFFFLKKYPFSKNAFQYVPGAIRTVLWE